LAIMILAPEAFLLRAWDDWCDACSLVKTLSKRYPSTPWTETHGMMSVMGGFKVITEGQPERRRTLCNNLWGHSQWEIDYTGITEDVILDKSKGSAIAKSLVLFQATWFVVQCVARHVQGLPVTELELVTLGHVFLVTMIYFLWWNKPLDVQFPITLHAKHRTKEVEHSSGVGAEEEDRSIANDGNIQSLGSHTPLAKQLKHAVPVRLSWRVRLGHTLSNSNISVVSLVFFIFVVPGIPFGGIHCLGWNSHFSSHVKQLLWRISALLVTVLPILISALAPIVDGVLMLPFVVLCILPLIYVCARLCLLALAFSALRSLPPAAFQAPSWTAFIPHL